MVIEQYSDNAGLIRKLHNRSQYQVCYPNSTLDPDWDIVEQIHATTKQIGFHNHTFEWVKGHQDDKPGAILDTNAQYNVRADELANEYFSTTATPNLLSPLLPSAR